MSLLPLSILETNEPSSSEPRSTSPTTSFDPSIFLCLTKNYESIQEKAESSSSEESIEKTALENLECMADICMPSTSEPKTIKENSAVQEQALLRSVEPHSSGNQTGDILQQALLLSDIEYIGNKQDEITEQQSSRPMSTSASSSPLSPQALFIEPYLSKDASFLRQTSIQFKPDAQGKYKAKHTIIFLLANLPDEVVVSILNAAAADKVYMSEKICIPYQTYAKLCTIFNNDPDLANVITHVKEVVRIAWHAYDFYRTRVKGFGKHQECIMKELNNHQFIVKSSMMEHFYKDLKEAKRHCN